MAKIYTRTGDRGETGLWGGGRVPKSHPRIKACGEVDECNSALGAAIAALPASPALRGLRRTLEKIQEELFVVGALLATPPDKLDGLGPPFDRGLPPGAAAGLEAEIDRLTVDLKPLKRFILPGGSAPGALLHVARAVCRRAEREVVGLGATESVPSGLVVYLNRLSDLLFTAARWVNVQSRRKETPWRGLAS